MSAQGANSRRRRGSLQFPPVSGVAVRQAPEFQGAGEDPVLIGLKMRRLFPLSQFGEQFWNERHQFARPIGLHIVHSLVYDASLNIELAAEPIYITPFQGQQFTHSKTKAEGETSHGSERLPQVCGEHVKLID